MKYKIILLLISIFILIIVFFLYSKEITIKNPNIDELKKIISSKDNEIYKMLVSKQKLRLLKRKSRIVNINLGKAVEFDIPDSNKRKLIADQIIICLDAEVLPDNSIILLNNSEAILVIKAAQDMHELNLIRR